MARGMIIVDTLGPALDVMAATTTIRVVEAFEDGADEVEAYAKQNAPWTDRTGAARDGLTAEVDEEDGTVILELYHLVDYGIYLELKNDGQYAIIMPTLEAIGPEILRRAGAQVVNVEGIVP